jgi:hypothetical protein
MLSQIGFTDLTDSASIRSGTLEIVAWNELLPAPVSALASGLDTIGTIVTLTSLPAIAVGSIVQIESEMLSVVSINTVAKTLTVARAVLASTASSHSPGVLVFPLQTSTIVVPFAQNFFSNRASQNFVHTAHLPDIRVCGSQFFVTNSFGDSQAGQQCYTTMPEGGLRTLSGGQFSMQVAGALATEQNAAPPVLVSATHSVRDVLASVGQAPTGYAIAIQLLQNGTTYASLTILSGATVSNVVNGVTLPALSNEATLSVNLQLNKLANYNGTFFTGSDLSVTIRF